MLPNPGWLPSPTKAREPAIIKRGLPHNLWMWPFLVIIWSAWFGILASHVHAEIDVVVNTVRDPPDGGNCSVHAPAGACSLRAAITYCVEDDRSASEECFVWLPPTNGSDYYAWTQGEIELTSSVASAIQLTIAGTTGSPEHVVISANHSSRFATLRGMTVAVTVDGVHFSGFNATTVTDADEDLSGGVFSIQETYATTFSRCIFSDSTAYEGGALFAIDALWLTFSDVEFTDLTAAYEGGAVYLEAASFTTFTLTSWTRCVSGEYGGGLLLNSNNYFTTVTESVFSNCSAAEGGGGISATTSNVLILVSRTVFTENRPYTLAGGILLQENNHGVQVHACTFVANGSPGALAGCINFHSFNWFATITSSTFTRNEGISAGGLLIGYGSFDYLIHNCSFTEHEGVAAPAVLVSELASEIRFENCTFVNNTATGWQSLGVLEIHTTGDVSVKIVSPIGTAGAVALDASTSEIRFVACEFRSNYAQHSGGAVTLLGFNYKVEFDRCTWVNNTCAGEGGALWSGSGAFASSIVSCVLANNSAVDGSALFLGELDQWIVQDSVLRGNTASGKGTTVLRYGSDTAFVNTTFERNVASSGGAVWGSSVLRVNATNITVVDCHAIKDGGGILLYDTSGSVSVQQSDFSHNVAGGAGGALWFGSSSLSLESATTLVAAQSGQAAEIAVVKTQITSNEAGVAGAGVFIGVEAHVVMNDVNITGNNISWRGYDYTDSLDTGATAGGAGLYAAALESLVIDNDSVLSGNNAGDTTVDAAADSSVRLWGGGLHLLDVKQAELHGAIKDNSAYMGGGAVVAVATTLVLGDNTTTQIVGNSARWGGGGGLFWTPNENGSLSVVGSALGHNLDENDDSDLLSVVQRNRAIYGYGDDVATPPYGLRIPVGLQGASAESVQSFRVGVVDAYNQTVTADNGNFVIASINGGCNASSSIGGQTVAVTATGGAEFTDLVVTCVPDSTVSLGVSLSSQSSYDAGTTINLVDDTSLHLRPCARGEVILGSSEERCTSCTSGTYWTNGKCKVCPDHATCDGSADLDVEAGYYRQPTNASVVILQCPGRHKSCSGGTSTANEQCVSGNKGPLCSKCDDGWFSNSPAQPCAECDGTREFAPLLIAVGLLVAFLLVVLAARSRVIRSKVLQLDRKNTFTTSERLKLCLSFCQIVAQFSFMFDIAFPQPYRDFVDMLAFTNLDLQGLFALSCSDLQVGFYGSLLAHTIGPVLFAVLVLVLGLVRRLRVRHPREIHRVRDSTLSWFLFLCYIVFPSSSTVVLQTFACDSRFADGESYLKADYGISCHSDSYRTARLYAAFMVLVYPVGIPVLFLALLWRYRRKLDMPPWLVRERLQQQSASMLPDDEGSDNDAEDAGESDGEGGAGEDVDVASACEPLLKDFDDSGRCEGVMREGVSASALQQAKHNLSDTLVYRYRQYDGRLAGARVLYEGYRPRYWWMEAVECVRRLCLSGLLVLFYPGTSTQILGGFLVTMAFLAFYSGLSPFGDSFTNALMSCTLWSLAIQLVLSLLLHTDSASQDSSALGACLLIFGLLPPVMLVVGEFVRIKAEKQEEADLQKAAEEASPGLGTSAGTRERRRKLGGTSSGAAPYTSLVHRLWVSLSRTFVYWPDSADGGPSTKRGSEYMRELNALTIEMRKQQDQPVVSRKPAGAFTMLSGAKRQQQQHHSYRASEEGDTIHLTAQTSFNTL